MPALEGPVLFRTIAGLLPVILCFWRRPKPHAGFLGAVGFARCLDGFARVKETELDFEFGLGAGRQR